MKSIERQFIHEVKSRPFLYNKKASTLADQQQCSAAWTEIAKIFNMKSAEQAEAKWKSHEEQFMQYMCRDTPYDYPCEMSFLQQYIFQRDMDNDSDLDYQELSHVLQQNDNELEGKAMHIYVTTNAAQTKTEPLQSPNITIENSGNVVEVLLSTDDIIYVEGHEQINQETEPKPKALLDEETAPVKTESNIPNTVTQQNAENSIVQNFSSIELIFLGYAKTISNMPMPLQLKIKRAIAEIMDKAEIELMNSK